MTAPLPRPPALAVSISFVTEGIVSPSAEALQPNAAPRANRDRAQGKDAL